MSTQQNTRVEDELDWWQNTNNNSTPNKIIKQQKKHSMRRIQRQDETIGYNKTMNYLNESKAYRRKNEGGFVTSLYAWRLVKIFGGCTVMCV